MTHIVLTSWWPYSKGEEVQNKYYEILPRFQAVVKSIKIYFKNVKVGMRGMVFFEIEQGKLEEAMTTINALAAEITAIEGFTFEIETQVSLEEALANQAAQAAQG